MADNRPFPYIPNTNPAVEQSMLDYIGVEKLEDLYSFIPEDILLGKPMNLPKPIEDEMGLKKHMDRILSKNISCNDYLNFLGAGCYDHYIPAICDEMNSRSEFVTTYSNDTYRDHGKNQIYFEYASMMGELTHFDVVCFPVYDGGQAVCTSIMMTTRITGRKKALIPATVSPTLLQQMESYCVGVELVKVGCKENGQMSLDDLEKKLSNDDVAGVMIQNPGFLGFFEEQAEEIGALAHRYGARFVVYADPATLGVIAAPADYGADIACGEIQPLGIHMAYGSGLGGYIATPQEDEYIMNYPGHLHGMFTNDKGEFGFFRTLQKRITYFSRDKAVEFVGTYVGLWCVTAAIYMAVMGPEGMRELGENIFYRSAYAKKKLEGIPGLKLPFSENRSFREFVVNFDDTGKTVAEINKLLLKRKIFGGYDLSRYMPQLGQAMLLCVTEKTDFEDIDTLVSALRDITGCAC